MGDRCPGPSVGQGDARIGFDDAEGEAFLEVEAHGVGVMLAVSDGQVLADVEEEVAAALAQYDGAVQAWGPGDRAVEDPLEVVEQGVAAVFGGLDDAGP